jgi:hypothetical protein
MTSSNTLKKLVSIGAAMLLAVGGSLTSATPASAAELTSPSLAGGNATVRDGMTSFSLDLGCAAYSGTANLSDWSLTVSGGTQTLSSVNLFGYIVVTLSSALAGGETVTLTYTKNGSRVIGCTNNSNTVGSFTFTSTAPAAAGVSGTPTLSKSGTTLTAVPATSSGASQYWYLCDSSKTANNAAFNPPAMTAISGCSMLFTSAGTSSPANTTTLNLTGTYYVRAGSMGSYTYPAASFSGGHVVFVQAVNTGSVMARSASVTADTVSSSGGSEPTAPALTAEQAKNALKPVPAAVQPLVPGFLALNKPMASLGGKVALSAGDFSGLTAAKIGDKTIDFTLGTTGNISFTVPQGEAGKTADLVLTFNTGSIILQDAIKYVAPLDVAKVGVRPLAIAAGATKITEEVAGQIRQAAFANVKNDTIQCVAYATSGSSAAKAAAQLTAVQACGLAVKANSSLKVVDVEVIVDKLKARTQGVGIKVYKADN